MGKTRKAELISSGMDIPDYVIESIARSLLPVIRDYYETDEGQRSFKEWQERQNDLRKAKTQIKVCEKREVTKMSPRAFCVLPIFDILDKNKQSEPITDW